MKCRSYANLKYNFLIVFFFNSQLKVFQKQVLFYLVFFNLPFATWFFFVLGPFFTILDFQKIWRNSRLLYNFFAVLSSSF